MEGQDYWNSSRKGDLRKFRALPGVGGRGIWLKRPSQRKVVQGKKLAHKFAQVAKHLGGNLHSIAPQFCILMYCNISYASQSCTLTVFVRAKIAKLHGLVINYIIKTPKQNVVILKN
jgi:hypothetical protein